MSGNDEKRLSEVEDRIKLERLRSIRQEQGYSHNDMAEILELKSGSCYYQKEKGLRTIKLSEAKIIADEFGMKVDRLFFNETMI